MDKGTGNSLSQIDDDKRRRLLINTSKTDSNVMSFKTDSDIASRGINSKFDKDVS